MTTKLYTSPGIPMKALTLVMSVYAVFCNDFTNSDLMISHSLFQIQILMCRKIIVQTFC